MSETTSRPDRANAQVTGGGGAEPDPDVTPSEQPQPVNTTAGVDLKSSELPDPEE